MDEDHVCGQAGTLATICSNIESINDALREIKENQKEYIKEQAALRDLINQANIDRAKYPSAEKVDEYIKKVERHEILLGILIASGVFVVTWVSGVLKRILGLG